MPNTSKKIKKILGLPEFKWEPIMLKDDIKITVIATGFDANKVTKSGSSQESKGKTERNDSSNSDDIEIPSFLRKRGF